MSTDELAEEVAVFLVDWSNGLPFTDARSARWMRVNRELARRDYRFRAHGRDCTCADCWMLWDWWQQTQRHIDPDIADFVPPLA